MSDRAVEKLQAIGQHDKATRAANAKFAAQFARLPKDVRTIVEVLKRVHSSDQNTMTTEVAYEGDCCTVTPVRKAPLMTDSTLERMANKIISGLRHGWTVTEPHQLTFLGTLTADESKMTDEKFVSHLDKHAPDKATSLARYDADGLKPEFMTDAPLRSVVVPSGKRCALRSQCVKAEKRLGAWVKGESKYCSTMCLGRAKAITKAGNSLPAD
jgi:hypothetical protein